MISMAMLVITRSRNSSAIQYVSVPLGLAFIVRPLAAIPIAVFTVYMLIHHRQWFMRYALWGVAVVAPWAIYNVVQFHLVLPHYYGIGRAVGSSTFGEALLGNLMSPSRGLFVYSPVFILALSGFVLALCNREDRSLNISFGVMVVIHFIAISRYPHWWGGHSFGPRLMTDVVPFLCYFVAFNLETMGTMSKIKRRALVGCFVLLAVASVFVHGRGAISSQPWTWNYAPDNVDQNPARLWDWNDPQFARGWIHR